MLSTCSLVGATTIALGVLASPLPLAAQCPRGAIRALNDGSGQRWDFNSGGTVVNGSEGSFDGLGTAFIDGTRVEPPMALVEDGDDGRTYTFSAPPVSGVILRRFVFVPNDRAFVRWVDVLQNIDGAVTNNIRYELQTNTGYDGDFFATTDAAEVVTTSDGDATLEASDRWYSIDNILRPIPDPDGPLTETSPRAFCEVHWGMGGAVAPTLITSGSSFRCGGEFDTDQSGATVRYMLTIPPASRVSILHFAVQGSRATVNAACTNLALLGEDLYGDLDNETRSEIVNFLVPISEGQCASILDCEPGLFCVDGYCCNAPCIGGANDCQACSVAAGAPENGTCAPIALGRSCRGATGPCDRPERCDGVTIGCPPNLIEPPIVVCRAAVTGCDVAENCTGTSVLCPTDRIAFEGTVCRAGTGDCRPPARCDGDTITCPESVNTPDGTTCNDSLGCTYSRCADGFCTSMSGSCDDGDICTADSCSGVTCTNAYMSGCMGGRDAGPDSGGGGGVNYPDVPMDVGPVVFDEDAPGFDAPYDGPLPFDPDVDPDFDGGPFFDAGGLRDGEVPMDGSMTADVEDRAEITGGGCMCRTGARSDGGAAIGLGMLVAAVIGRRRRRG
jgi:hypothetical protein